ncbi:DUF5723 family protein [Hymenobacter sp.]|uniref:DUF5723 family protein n=1 Tax=Hymenobacter sp. TaxID=1898978 RepID=UPI00286B3405|nr:DUF5723 family protein [Hymenobacter sp.]
MSILFRLLPLAALLALPAALRAQNELSNFTATGRGGVANAFAADYQAIGINPGNLGRIGGARVTFSLLEFGVGASSKSLTNNQLNKIIYSPDDNITSAERTALVSNFANENALNGSLEHSLASVAVALPYGSVAASWRQRLTAEVSLNRTAAEIFFLGRDAPVFQSAALPRVSVALAGTEMKLALTDEYNVAYGAPLVSQENFQLSGGVGYRYIRGIGAVDFQVKEGRVEAYSSLSPLFNVQYGNIATGPNFDFRDGGDFEAVGSGHGFDVGLAAEIGDQLRLSASLTDLGSMTWKGNLLTAADQTIRKTDSEGLQTYNIFEEAARVFGNNSESPLQYAPDVRRSAKLPAKFRGGVAYRIDDRFEAGFDVTAPLNEVAGNFASSYFGLGVDFKPAPWVRLSTGTSTGAGYGFGLPLGVTFVTDSYEAGIASRDVTGYFTENKPYVSLALGFLRFKFGKVGEE